MPPIPKDVQRATELDNSRALDLRRDSSALEVLSALSSILAEMRTAGLENRKNAFPLEKTLRAVIFDLYVAYKCDSTMYLHLSLNSKTYQSKLRYSPNWHSYRAMRAVIEHLEKQGYITKDPGFHDRSNSGKGRQTRIRSTKKLINVIENDPNVNVSMIWRHGEFVLCPCCGRPAVVSHGQIVEDQADVASQLAHFLRHAAHTFGFNCAYGKAAQPGDIFRPVAFADTAAVFVEVPVDDVMAFVFDAPMAAVYGQQASGVGLLGRSTGDTVSNLK